MTVLVIRGTTRIAKYYTIVCGLGFAMAGLALGREERFGGFSPLDCL